MCIEFQFYTNQSEKIMLRRTIIAPDFLRNLTAMLKQWQQYFTQTKHGFTFQTTSFQGIIEYGQAITPALKESPWHPIKVGVWCAVSKRRIIGPIFFDSSVDSEVYTKIIKDFITLLEPEERYAWF